MTASRDAGTPSRISGLDGLRGYAAFVVLLNHIALIYPGLWLAHEGNASTIWSRLVMNTPVHLLVAGDEAVRIFFALSGFVLSLPYWSGGGPSYLSFAVRRVIRLYIPFFVAVILATVITAAVDYRIVEGTSDWFRQYWMNPVSWRDIISALLMVNGGFSKINTVIWTLIVEMRISLALPLIILAMRYLKQLSIPVAMGISFSASAAQRRIALSPTELDIATTAAQLWFFVIGAEIARHHTLLKSLPVVRNAKLSYAALAISCLMLISAFVFPGNRSVFYVISGVGAGLIVALFAASPSVMRLGQHSAGQFLGRISYSLYLVHFPVLVGGILLVGRAPTVPDVLLIILVVVLVATLFNRLVEEPSIGLSRTLGRFLDRRSRPSADTRRALERSST